MQIQRQESQEEEKSEKPAEWNIEKQLQPQDKERYTETQKKIKNKEIVKH